MANQSESDRQILTRLDERVHWLVKNEEKRVVRINQHGERISNLERFRAYTVGIGTALGIIGSALILALRLQWL